MRVEQLDAHAWFAAAPARSRSSGAASSPASWPRGRREGAMRHRCLEGLADDASDGAVAGVRTAAAALQ